MKVILQNTEAQNLASKHQIGAEVNLYVAGLEHNPEVVLNTIFAFYRSTPRYAGEGKDYTQFDRYEKETKRLYQALDEQRDPHQALLAQRGPKC